MRNGFTLKDLQSSACSKLNPHLFEKPKVSDTKQPRKIRKDCKQVVWIKGQLTYWCMINKLTLKSEYRFHPARKWRSDWCIEELKCLIEYNGIFSDKSRHTTCTGYTGDMDKINAAQSLGFKVLQFTPLNYKNVIQELEKFNE